MSTGCPTEVALQVFAHKLGMGRPSLVAPESSASPSSDPSSEPKADSEKRPLDVLDEDVDDEKQHWNDAFFPSSHSSNTSPDSRAYHGHLIHQAHSMYKNREPLCSSDQQFSEHICFHQEDATLLLDIVKHPWSSAFFPRTTRRFLAKLVHYSTWSSLQYFNVHLILFSRRCSSGPYPHPITYGQGQLILLVLISTGTICSFDVIFPTFPSSSSLEPYLFSSCSACSPTITSFRLLWASPKRSTDDYAYRVLPPLENSFRGDERTGSLDITRAEITKYRECGQMRPEDLDKPIILGPETDLPCVSTIGEEKQHRLSAATTPTLAHFDLTPSDSTPNAGDSGVGSSQLSQWSRFIPATPLGLRVLVLDH
ncbi:hypothetical protein K435DRAFT_876738 [Dendrothele bispora CBS 962.96]|uniref:Uncharacterized protein n=1 Tax=Dendrothele bispora (strain CBS 962.96) TaxID=1314807 RepID=A0A4S8KRE1_DENBC|nr:hypothetical protein K435DRAFT_876738 [Dendrothele bispora CBS 962.96]